MTMIRPAAVAGAFYPAPADEVRRLIALLLAAAPRAAGPPPKAVIVPHAGWVYSGPIAAHAYARLAPLAGRVSRVVLLGPAHRISYRGIALSGADAWASPLGPIALDVAGAQALARPLPGIGRFDDAHAQEHSLEVQVPFIQTVLGLGVQLLPLLVGDEPPELVDQAIDLAWGGPETVVIVSTDLSHFLDAEACAQKDAATRAAIEDLAPERLERDDACGRLPLAGLLLVARRRGMRIETLDVRHSGDTAGTRDRVVGYGAWALFESDGAAAAVDPSADEATAIHALGPQLLGLARESIEAGLRGERMAPSAVTGRLAAPGAAFVTLKRHGHLRGCIGSPLAWRPLVEDVCDNAVKAAFADPRFPPLGAGERDGLTVSVSVLTAPEPVRFTGEADLLAQMRPRRDGLIIEDRGHRALFLPAVWDPRQVHESNWRLLLREFDGLVA
jgi:AmmeMemoRadiSam system protein B/AmmeMemoRadiSam system protein A